MSFEDIKKRFSDAQRGPYQWINTSTLRSLSPADTNRWGTDIGQGDLVFIEECWDDMRKLIAVVDLVLLIRDEEWSTPEYVVPLSVQMTEALKELEK